MEDLDGLLDLARGWLSPRIDREAKWRRHVRKPLPTTYCSIEIWRLEAGLAVLPVSKCARTLSVSFLKSGPWNSLPTKLPPGASTCVAISSARSNRASERA